MLALSRFSGVFFSIASKKSTYRPAVIGTFRVVPEQDLETVTTPCAHLRDEGLVDTVDLGRDERVLTKERAEHSYSKCRRAKERPEPDFR